MALPPIAMTLTDGTGRTTTPAIRATACGLPPPAVDQAIEASSRVTIETRDATK